MFTIGDLVIYSTHGICKIDDICERTVGGKTREYYVLLPKADEHQLKISVPVDNKQGKILELMNKDQSVEILESFKGQGAKWNENANVRFNSYTKLVNAGEREDIASVVNTLMRKEMEFDTIDRRLHQRDHQLLNEAQDVLFGEIALTLNTTKKDINNRVRETILTH